MKRHNAKAIAAAVAIAAVAASAEGKKKSEPKPTISAAALYVDVVKNMANAETPPPATPPLPKFTILHEDFPALPGTIDETLVINAGVPDDWTVMISDDDDDDDEKNEDDDDDDNGDDNDDGDDEDDDDEDDDVDDDDDDDDEWQSVSSSASLESVTNSLPDSIEPEPMPDLLVELQSSSSISSKSSPTNKLEQPDIAQVAASTDCSNANSSSEELNSPKNECHTPNVDDSVNTSIFDKQFLLVGAQQRAWIRQKSSEAKLHLGPPPGFQHVKFYGRLRTNRMGAPLGGVTFDTTVPPPPASQQSSGQVLKDAYGLAGLAKNLQAAQQHPRLVPHIFGHELSCLNVHTHCSAYQANKLHASFAGALQGGRSEPHEVQHNVPLYYRRPGGTTLPQPKVGQMKSELLFFFFYTYPNDMLQMLAAAELAECGWRFHIQERLWIRRQPDNPHYIVTRFQESGEYNYFNMMHWKIMQRHFELLPEQLEHTITKAELRDQYGYHPQMSFF